MEVFPGNFPMNHACQYLHTISDTPFISAMTMCLTSVPQKEFVGNEAERFLR